jgi:tetratricopeptide (TPR) repeat protein
MIFIFLSVGFWKFTAQKNHSSSPAGSESRSFSPTPFASNDLVLEKQLPSSKMLPNNYHIFQSFNNCGPAALSMALSYFGINKSQQELGQDLRPYQNPQGDNDDKSVTLEEVAIKAEELGLKAYLRPNGDINKIRQFIAAGLPVITRTYLKPGEDIGHYRIIKGYDDNTQQLIQDDSLQGKNLKYSYQDFDILWADFNHKYLVLVPSERQSVVEEIIGDDLDEKRAWEKAVKVLEAKLSEDPSNTVNSFNLSVSKYKVQDFKGSVEAFEKVESKLSFRTLWYQIEPIYSYYELGNYDRVLQLSDKILNNQNRAFSELYILKARVYLKQGAKSEAAEQLALAKLYNRNIKIEAQLLESINN